MNIIIIGGGFAGLQLAHSLNNKKGIDVLLIDRNNYHQFQPLFYQVATAGLDASNISFPLRKVFHNSKNIRFRMAMVKSIDTSQHNVLTDIGAFFYDRLVIATGADTNFFGNTVLQQHAFPMKSTTEALQLRHKLIENFEEALQIKELDARQPYMNIVVVGGGPTGVEVSGALAEMSNNVLPKDYPELDFSTMHIYLVEGSGKTLAAMSEKSSAESSKYLRQLGVTVLTNTVVKNFDGNLVTLSNGELINSKIVIWAAGIKGNVPEGIDASLIARGNRIMVNRINKVQNTADVYALGDIAYMETPLYPHGHPQVANVAINQAKVLAANFIQQQKGNAVEKEFEYADKGSMATVGRHLAVVDIPSLKLHFGGFLAWLVWMFLHLMLILGVKNRLQIFINWMYKYFTYDQSLRLLFKNSYRVTKD
ncbi:NAD(P)/FAD-dependent oxidoreductase [Limnovirga soli]|uniref:NADH:ubiquinone reductase (non-electrogenic) n=1 Tax=Limnovirga soli TaxID=2656915 RepID=A0A8J8JSG0_9BACT|nr:FAD-dependent oxidoreductase [Limnovirga soli]NNV54723.1 NAD(P)/FAD-dependent oxidoreductase [Limnovirga soli]